jgi:DNA-binding NtrC family response regulator
MMAIQGGNHSQHGENRAPLAILVVDDEPLIRWSLREALRAHGHTVSTASTGAEALRVVAESTGHFDVVILDYRLPDRHDLSLLEDLQAASRESAVVMMTAFADDDMRVRALARGVKAVVGKPFQLKSFVSLIESAVAS